MESVTSERLNVQYCMCVGRKEATMSTDGVREWGHTGCNLCISNHNPKFIKSIGEASQQRSLLTCLIASFHSWRGRIAG